MSFFQAGLQGGQVNSPAFGIGSAIKGILEQAKKSNLIQQQGQASIMPAIMKGGIEQAINQQPTQTHVFNANTGEQTSIPHTRGESVKTAGSTENPMNQIMANMMQNAMPEMFGNPNAVPGGDATGAGGDPAQSKWEADMLKAIQNM